MIYLVMLVVVTSLNVFNFSPAEALPISSASSLVSSSFFPSLTASSGTRLYPDGPTHLPFCQWCSKLTIDQQTHYSTLTSFSVPATYCDDQQKMMLEEATNAHNLCKNKHEPVFACENDYTFRRNLICQSPPDPLFTSTITKCAYCQAMLSQDAVDCIAAGLPAAGCNHKRDTFIAQQCNGEGATQQADLEVQYGPTSTCQKEHPKWYCLQLWEYEKAFNGDCSKRQYDAMLAANTMEYLRSMNTPYVKADEKAAKVNDALFVDLKNRN